MPFAETAETGRDASAQLKIADLGLELEAQEALEIDVGPDIAAVAKTLRIVADAGGDVELSYLSAQGKLFLVVDDMEKAQKALG